MMTGNSAARSHVQVLWGCGPCVDPGASWQAASSEVFFCYETSPTLITDCKPFLVVEPTARAACFSRSTNSFTNSSKLTTASKTPQ